MKINKKIKETLYEYWKLSFPYILPIIGTLLLYFWDKFRTLMSAMIPFWILFIFLLLLGFLITALIILSNKVKSLSQKNSQIKENVVLINNLIYKTDNKNQAFCPVCYEKSGELKRMKRNFWINDNLYYYECFVCGHEERVDFEKEENKDLSDIL
ncbi:MAG: hypothetical protein WC468_02735 [Candidatus Paceibacterota bacterium]